MEHGYYSSIDCDYGVDGVVPNDTLNLCASYYFVTRQNSKGLVKPNRLDRKDHL
jgi:hypothetical protein